MTSGPAWHRLPGGEVAAMRLYALPDFQKDALFSFSAGGLDSGLSAKTESGAQVFDACLRS